MTARDRRGGPWGLSGGRGAGVGGTLGGPIRSGRVDRRAWLLPHRLDDTPDLLAAFSRRSRGIGFLVKDDPPAIGIQAGFAQRDHQQEEFPIAFTRIGHAPIEDGILERDPEALHGILKHARRAVRHRIKSGKTAASPGQPINDGHAVGQACRRIRMLLQSGQETAALVRLPPSRGEFGEASPTIVIQALVLGFLVTPALFFSLPAFGLFPFAPLLHQKGAGNL